MKIISELAASEYRDLFIHSFVDQNSQYYQKYFTQNDTRIKQDCIYGYYWGCMVNVRIITVSEIVNYVESLAKRIYIFWDDHPIDNTQASMNLHVPANSVLIADSEEIRDLLPLLPEDCYIFDDTLTVAFALTHEEIKRGRRYCIESRPN